MATVKPLQAPYSYAASLVDVSMTYRAAVSLIRAEKCTPETVQCFIGVFQVLSLEYLRCNRNENGNRSLLKSLNAQLEKLVDTLPSVAFPSLENTSPSLDNAHVAIFRGSMRDLKTFVLDKRR